MLSHIRSRRGMLLIATSVSGVLALFLDAPWSVVFGLLALGGFAGLILILSVRLSQIVTRLGVLGRSIGRRSPTMAAPAERSTHETRAATRMTSAIDTLGSAADRLAAEPSMSERNLTPKQGHTPRVTIVVPCYNEERFVAEAIRSIAEQTFTDWECLVVDDASTDSSLKEIWAATNSDQRFRVLRHQVNSGLSAARNTGLRAARGQLVTFLDADDLLMRDSLMDRVIALANAMADPHVIGSYCGVTVAFEEVDLDELPDRMEGDSRGIIDLVSADAECPFNAHAPLLITERLRALGGFNERMRYGAEDWHLWYRAMRNGYVFVPSHYKTAVYRQKRNSMVRSMPDGHVLEANRLINAAYQHVDPELLVDPSPTPLTKPINEYQAQIHRARRAIRFAAMALVAGDEAAARRALVVFQEAPLSLIERHIDLTDMTDRGMQRALAVSRDELTAMSTLSEPIRSRMRALIGEVSKSYVPEPVTSVTKPSIGALLVPQHAGQIPQMLEAAAQSGFSEGTIGVLTIEREGGSQGATIGAPESLPTWSLNEWALRTVTCSTAFVGKVR
ncbi:MAG TPA: glycosyltransferase family A protein, partial [Acidimicrobiia bacterium]